MQNYAYSSLSPNHSGYADVDQGKLFYQRFGQGQPIIVVHGGPGGNHNQFLPQMLELAKDYELIFYDQRGSGRSLEVSLDPKYVSLDSFSRDLEKLRLELGLKKITLLGHSWGGLLSMDYAIKHPENVSSLILLNSVPADYKGTQAFMNEFGARTQTIQDKILPFFNSESFQKLEEVEIHQVFRDLFSLYFKDPSKVKEVTIDMSKESAVSGLKVMALMSQTSWATPDVDLFPGLRNLKMPTLIIHGNQDMIPAYTTKEIHSAIADSKIVYLENCGHCPFIEAPEALFQSVRSFLSHDSK